VKTVTTWLASAALLGIVPLLLASGQAKAQSAPKAKSSLKAATTKKSTVPDDTPPNKALGSKSAPITIEVFSDYQCPACKLLYVETLRPLMDNYVSTGKVYLIHRDYPLQMHQHSREAARLANAAARFGSFEKVDAQLYARQESWEKDGNLEGAIAPVLTPANLKRVRELARSGKMDPFIESDLALGQARNVNQTPSMFITHHGQMYPLPPGGVSYSLLKRFLDQLLQQ
jgi:protein-disulfide isomerase